MITLVVYAVQPKLCPIFMPCVPGNQHEGGLDGCHRQCSQSSRFLSCKKYNHTDTKCLPLNRQEDFQNFKLRKVKVKILIMLVLILVIIYQYQYQSNKKVVPSLGTGTVYPAPMKAQQILFQYCIIQSAEVAIDGTRQTLIIDKVDS